MASETVQPHTLKRDGEKGRIERLKSIGAPHIQSFDFAMTRGLQLIPKYIEPSSFCISPEGDGEGTIRLWIRSVSLKKPKITFGSGADAESRTLYPSDCLRSGSSYVGDLMCKLGLQIDDEVEDLPVRKVGRMPVMVGSTKCNLHGMTPEQLVKHGEEEYEFGGYFVINGSERLIRMTLVQRVNHPVSAMRDKNASRGSHFTHLSQSVRCERPDLSTLTIHMHLMKSGNVLYRFRFRGNEFFIPVGLLLRALLPPGRTYRDIYDEFFVGDTTNVDVKEGALAILVDLQDKVSRLRKEDCEPGVRPSVSRTAAVSYFGRSFRLLMDMDERIYDDYAAGESFLRQFICPHLSVGYSEKPSEELDIAKADFLVHLCRKLFATRAGEIEVDKPDALSHLQLLLPGTLCLLQMKDRLSQFLLLIKILIRKKVKLLKEAKKYDRKKLHAIVHEAIQKAFTRPNVGEKVVYMITTGNVVAEENLDLSSNVGLSIMAERINFLRFVSHFRAVHRGSFYAKMRSTEVRKLLPEAWGFICPVHTPDGAPCGILNHMASLVNITQGLPTDPAPIVALIEQIHSGLSTSRVESDKLVPVILDGRVIKYINVELGSLFAYELRSSKVSTHGSLPPDAEVVHVPLPRKGKGFFPGIYIFTNGGRLVRPVKWLLKRSKRSSRTATNLPAVKSLPGESNWESPTENIGTFEQVFMRIRPAVVDPNNKLTPVYSRKPTHAEVSSTAFLSLIASLSPFPDMNQGPRNMFQCQMAKQAMGTPCHVFSKRFEAKSYRLTNPQAPITRNFCMQDPVGVDLFGNGLNAIVAVISYTGNDMEDALIMNQASLNRGFAHGTVYETKTIDVDESRAGTKRKLFQVTSNKDPIKETVDSDGLPAVGVRLNKGDTMFGIVDSHMNYETSSLAEKAHWTRHKSVETHTVDSVIISDTAAYKAVTRARETAGIRHARIRTRVSRTPIVGDKFASRAGQKGTVAAAWPMDDMPFSESGMVPDIMFNPNGFPSRMTIGMMVESMAGKAGALHGVFQDSTPFRFDENNRAVEHFAEQLSRAGYSYYGSETLYSGYTGEPFEVEIFMGVVHYQRLRHMVSDKFQVRERGRVNPLYRQPIKGRKKGGAIRFGEMERDGVLAHGASEVLRDRLGTASDIHLVHICERCRSLLTPITAATANDEEQVEAGQIVCLHCGGKKSDSIRKISMPYSFKYLANELAAMNIRTEIEVKEN